MILPPVVALALLIPTQSSPAGLVSFELDWPQAPVPHWSIQMGEQGAGRYDKFVPGALATEESKQPITVSAATQERLRAGYKAVMNGECETRLKHIAKTGVKRIAYIMAGSDAWSSCTFNASDDKGLTDAVLAFEGIAETMQLGEQLAHTLRFDRLGLDAEITSLESEVALGHAIELQNIAPVLQSIVEDERVIERARRKAARLLQSAPSDLSAP